MGNFPPASEFYMSTFRKLCPIFIPTCLWRWNIQGVPKRRYIKFRHRGITQKKAHNIHNTAKVSYQENFSFHSGIWINLNKKKIEKTEGKHELNIRKFFIVSKKYRVGHEKVARLPFCTCPCYCINFCIYVMLRTRATFSWPTLRVDTCKTESGLLFSWPACINAYGLPKYIIFQILLQIMLLV